MKKGIDYVAAILITLLGIAHVALTPVLAPQFESDPLEFAAVGMVFIFLGFFNLARVKSDERITHLFCAISNSLGAVWLCLSFIQNFTEGESVGPGILPAFALGILFVFSIFNIRKPKSVEL